MCDYWYTDEFGRKRHVQKGEPYNSNLRTYYRDESIKNSFSKYGGSSKDSYLRVTKCPVCSETVYFCSCSNGGRIFFETLAPHWTKHPCTSNNTYDSSKLNDRYSVILPIRNSYILHKDYEKRYTIFKVPSSPDFMKIETTNDILYKNLTENTTLLIREDNSKLYLTIIVTTKKFINQHICTDEVFPSQKYMAKFIEAKLSKVDFADSIDISHQTVRTSENKKRFIFDEYDRFKRKEVEKKGKKKPSRTKYSNNKRAKKSQKQKVLPKKESIKRIDEIKDLSIESLAENGWKIIK